MMEILMIAVFVLGYLAIALEHPIKVDKAASALLTGVLCWTIYMLFAHEVVDISRLPQSFLTYVNELGRNFTKHELITYYVGEYQILHYLGEIASILFFLMGAMTIVELIDAYEGFSIITDRITTKNKVKLLWVIGFLTFFLSAILDNLTTSIVMVSLLKKLIADKKERMFFAGMVVIAANAGGAWSPIGDVTTTMLWIGGQITAANIIKTLILPSIVCLAIPLIYLSFTMKGNIQPVKNTESHKKPIKESHKKIIFSLGVGGLIFVPVFKTLTHLPPYMGMLFSLGILWVVSEILNHRADQAKHSAYKVIDVLKKIDTPSVLFFLGILSAITALESTGILHHLAVKLDEWIPNQNIVVLTIGLLSSIVDNVPLVAASMGMYNFPTDHVFWEFIAYAAGTGGSVLIIGSAAGVAVMGIEKIDFIWYLKKMTLPALLGYFAGAIVYIYTHHWFIIESAQVMP